MTIKENKKRIMFTLDKDTIKMLDDLSTVYHINKSQLIDTLIKEETTSRAFKVERSKSNTFIKLYNKKRHPSERLQLIKKHQLLGLGNKSR